MVRSCVASFSDEAALPKVIGERVDVRPKGPAAKEPLVIKVYASENRFHHETENAAKLWKKAGPDLKAHLGVPFYGGRVSADEIKAFFSFNGKVRKNKAALNLHSGDTAAFRVASCEGVLSKAGGEVLLKEARPARPLFMTVSPRYEADLRTMLGKKGKADKVVVLREALDAVSKLNKEAVWSDAFVDNVMFHEGRAMLIDLDYLRDPERLFHAGDDGKKKKGENDEKRAPRAPRFGPAELVVPEALAFTLEFERAHPEAATPVPQEAVAPVYHPKGLAALGARVEGAPYAHAEGKTRGEWMRDALLLEQAAASKPDAATTMGVVDALAKAFPKAGAKLTALRLRYDPYRLAMSILALEDEGGVAWEARDAHFVTSVLLGLVRVDAGLRLTAAEAVQWLDAYIKARPTPNSKPKKIVRSEVEPLGKPPKVIKALPVDV